MCLEAYELDPAFFPATRLTMGSLKKTKEKSINMLLMIEQGIR